MKDFPTRGFNGRQLKIGLKWKYYFQLNIIISFYRFYKGLSFLAKKLGFIRVIKMLLFLLNRLTSPTRYLFIKRITLMRHLFY